MPRACSGDLRERALATCEAGEGRQSEIARPYRASERTLSGWLEAAREEGRSAPRLRRGGRAPVGGEREALAGLVAERSDATLAEYADLLAERGEAPVLRLCRPDDPYDPELLRLRDEDVPAVKVETEVERKRTRARKGLFLSATPLPEIQAAVSRVS